MTFQVFSETGPRAIGGGETQIFPVELENMTARRPAEPRCALQSKPPETGWRSNAERLMILSTSAVAVCC